MPLHSPSISYLNWKFPLHMQNLCCSLFCAFCKPPTPPPLLQLHSLSLSSPNFCKPLLNWSTEFFHTSNSHKKILLKFQFSRVNELLLIFKIFNNSKISRFTFKMSFWCFHPFSFGPSGHLLSCSKYFKNLFLVALWLALTLYRSIIAESSKLI